ncbi:MAG TPA: hypothetical protein VE986_09570 [Hyphomicrobiales bacterium]|nr:hypothetical protein [Hyphomicrobiales bacterium]
MSICRLVSVFPVMAFVLSSVVSLTGANAQSLIGYTGDDRLRAALRAGISDITPEQEDAVVSYVRRTEEPQPELQPARCNSYASKFGLKAYADCTHGPGAD